MITENETGKSFFIKHSAFLCSYCIVCKVHPETEGFFKIGFRLLYGLDTRWERWRKKEPVVKKNKCCWSLSSFVSCFMSFLETITSEVFYFPPSVWVGILDVCFYPSADSFLLLHPSGYPEHCVHLTGDAIWQLLPSSFSPFLFCSISKRPVVQHWQTMEVWLSILGHACMLCQKGKQIPQAFYLHRHNYSENSEWHRQQEKISFKKKKKGRKDGE